jgi:hypothetical protein
MAALLRAYHAACAEAQHVGAQPTSVNDAFFSALEATLESGVQERDAVLAAIRADLEGRPARGGFGRPRKRSLVGK